MQIKKFTANNVNEALRLVKAEFGGDAVILSTRSVKGKGVEVTAAIDREGLETWGSRGQGGKDIVRATLRGCPGRPQGAAPTGTLEPSNPRTLIKPEARNPKIETEIKELKEMVGTLMSQVQKDEFFRGNKRLSDLQKMLTDTGVDETLSYRMLQSLCKRLSPQDMEDISGLLKHLKRFIARQVDVAEITDNCQRPKVAVFVGPTGVGKTTTIAKLAAISSIQKKKNVALVTMDTYRIAAVEQLKVYARIIGIPVHVVNNPGEFARTVSCIKGADLILVDTAGRGQRDRVHMEELRRIHESGISLETHIVLSATAKERDTIDVIRKFKDMQIDRLLFTKLDETTTYGGIFNAIIASGKPVSYLANGQRVPEDIEAATAERVADLILNTVSR